MWWRLIFKEILQRKWGFLFSMLAIAIAIGAWVLVESITSSLKAEAGGLKAEADGLKAKADQVQNETTRILASMQLNMLIVPSAVPEDRYYRGDFGDETLPEWIVGALLDPSVMLRVCNPFEAKRRGEPKLQLLDKNEVNLDRVPQYIKYYELSQLADHYTAELQADGEIHAGGQSMKVILTGQRREQGRKSNKPVVVPPLKGKAYLGSAVAGRLGLKVGGQFDLAGRTFTVARVEPGQASIDDIRVYLALADAQAILNKPGLINRVLALSCQCEGVTISELAEVLDLYVREWSGRYQARMSPTSQPASGGIRVSQPLSVRVTPMTRIATARENVRASIDTQRQGIEGQWKATEGLHDSIRNVTAALMPMLGLIIALLVGGYFYFNVRERQQEMGVLLAIGFTPRPILLALLLKLAMVSLIGGAAGALVGFALAGQMGPAMHLQQVSRPWYLWPVAMGGAAALTLLAGIYPLTVAARTEAARILRNS